ncbi:MAG: hypothetical protein LUC30_03130 [Clostridiales bacterium]|nr:hypothetical protein [Clostridiales bacterium]
MTYNNEMLRRLAAACTDENARYADGLNFCELYRRTEDTAKADAAFNAALAAAGLPVEARDKIDSANGAALGVYEEQGFMNGFRLGGMLVKEARR